MTPAEKIMLKKAFSTLQNSLRWNGASQDWSGYANQMKNGIKTSSDLIETILELPENNQPQVPPPAATTGDRSFVEKLDDLLP